MNRLKVAIVDEESSCLNHIASCLKEYEEKERRCHFDISLFSKPLEFLDKVDDTYDIVFLDLNMPGIWGLELARKLRERELPLMIVCITNLAHCAIHGYDVGAFAFIVKPVAYDYLRLKLDRIVGFFGKRKAESLVLRVERTSIVIPLDSLRYIEVMNHTIVFHAESGNHKTTSSMKSVSKMLGDAPFALCSQSFMVNLAYVESLSKTSVVVAGEELPLSRAKRKEFYSRFIAYQGGEM